MVDLPKETYSILRYHLGVLFSVVIFKFPWNDGFTNLKREELVSFVFCFQRNNN